jgi:hypothetical protein
MNAPKTRTHRQPGLGLLAILLVAGMALPPRAARAQTCMDLLPLLRQGRSSVEIARITGLSANTVNDCRVQLSRPTQEGPAGPPPIGAAGRSPHGAPGAPPIGAAGAPPIGAAGPPPHGAAGPPPVGAAGPPPIGAAGPPPISRQPPRLP